MKFWAYLDSEVRGSMELLLQFFDRGVFDRRQVAVLFRETRRNARRYPSMLRNAGVAYHAFRKPADYPNLDGAVLYYLFNTNAHASMIAERQAKHVFVTHGESHKAGSTRPFLRVYDYVVTAGQAGVDRYLHAGVFTSDDVQGGRLVRMGDTFVVPSGYGRSTGDRDDWVLYAPTWEGRAGDDYCSLSSSDALAHVAAFAETVGLKRLVVQPHPTLGKRLPLYRKRLFDELADLAQQGFEIAMPDQVQLPWRWRSFSRGWPFVQRGKPGQFNIRKAFVDLSAMEVQMLSDGIECSVFLKELPTFVQDHHLLAPYYAQVGILDWRSPPRMQAPYVELEGKVKDYYLSYSDPALKAMTRHERLEWLSRYVREDPHWRRSSSI
jgi:hypothetical protein